MATNRGSQSGATHGGGDQRTTGGKGGSASPTKQGRDAQGHFTSTRGSGSSSGPGGSSGSGSSSNRGASSRGDSGSRAGNGRSGS